MFNRKAGLFFCCLLIGSLFASAQSVHKEAHNLLINAPTLRSAYIGISIYDPGQEKFVFKHQASQFFLPASNTKIPTCYLGMKYLGDSLLSFRVLESGDSLFISPAGDPTFLHPAFPVQTFFDSLRNSKKKIWLQYNSGDAITPYGSGWTWDGYQDAYLAERASMPIFGNLVHFVRNSGTTFSVSPKLAARPPYLNEPMIQLIDKGNRFEVDRLYDKNEFRFKKSGSVFIGQQVPFKTDNGVTNYLFLQDTLNRTMYNFSLGMQRDFKGYRPIYSQPTDSMLRMMMCESDNHFAEQTLLMVSQRRLGRLSDLDMIDAALARDFADLPDDPRWTDGSGLSRYNLFSPDDFVRILSRMQQEFGMQRIAGIFPTGGVGTLKSYYNNIPGQIYAKTGTLSGVVALSGFIQANSGKWLIFSILVNNHRTTPTIVRKAMEQFLLKVKANY